VPRIDLHSPTTPADGTDAPEELIATAAAAGVDVLAITDHDTTGGWDRAAAALPAGMRLVRGAEFSCVSDDGRGGRVSVHLLGYLFDPTHPAITAEQERLRGERVARLRGLTAKMADAGYPVDTEQVFSFLPEGATAGRPHLARALVAAGGVEAVDQAFAELLYTGSPFYVPKADTPVAVIADLAAAGLTGVEVDHRDHAPDDRALLRGLAAETGLVVTGSSDYHGTNKTIPIAAETTDPEQLEALVAKADGVEVLTG